MGESNPVMAQHLKYAGHREEDDGLISGSGRNQGALPMVPPMQQPGDDCYMIQKDSDGLTRKNSSGAPYLARHVS